MKFRSDLIIAEEKLTGYLLVKREFDDKSQFLSKAGYTLDNFKKLKDDILNIVLENEAVFQREDEYGKFYKINGILPGVNGNRIKVQTIWLKTKIDKSVRFITLIPDRRT